MHILLALVAGLVFAVAGCGGEDEPASPPATGSVDQAFVNRFAAHNDASRRIAAAGRRGAEAARIGKLATRLEQARKDEQAILRGLQERLGGSGPGRDPLGVTAELAAEQLQPDMLRGAKPFDRTFLQVMVQHHQGALNLIQAERSKGKDGAVKALADQLAVKRSEELNELTKLLAAQR